MYGRGIDPLWFLPVLPLVEHVCAAQAQCTAIHCEQAYDGYDH